MIIYKQPKLPIPAFLRGAEIGSFAHNTIVARLPDIAERVLSENKFPSHVVLKLKQLIQAVPYKPIRYLTDMIAPDNLVWQRYLKPYLGQNWLDVPWLFAEFYFYRRILEAVGYFELGPSQGLDPFGYQKQQGLQTNQIAINSLSNKLSKMLKQGRWDRQMCKTLLIADLWGNRADLSLWPAIEGQDSIQTTLNQADSHLLVDDSQQIVDYLDSINNSTSQLAFIIDNAGFELVCDLCLADFLLSTNKISTIQFHLKSQPTFVSDAMITDVKQTVAFLMTCPSQAVQDLGKRLQTHLNNGSLQLQTSLFWTSPLSFWEMPSTLYQNLAQANLIISKGDANYRRLLGDRHWPFDTPFSNIVCYFSVPIVALRTLKSEVLAGVPVTHVATLTKKDPTWLTNGQWGVIQLSINKSYGV